MKIVACLAAATIVSLTSLANVQAQQSTLVQPRLVPTPDHGYVRPATYLLGVYTTPVRLGNGDGPARQDIPTVQVRLTPRVVPSCRFGLRVDSVVPGSAAQRAGLERGDIVVYGNGQPTDSKPALQAAIQNSGGRLLLQVINVRNGLLTNVMTYPQRMNSYPAFSQR